MIETVSITVLTVWLKQDENKTREDISKQGKQELQNHLEKGFRIKLVTSCALEDMIFVTYVLEREVK